MDEQKVRIFLSTRRDWEIYQSEKSAVFSHKTHSPIGALEGLGLEDA